MFHIIYNNAAVDEGLNWRSASRVPSAIAELFVISCNLCTTTNTTTTTITTIIITGPPSGPVLFCTLTSVVVCNAAGRRAHGRSDGRHCTAGSLEWTCPSFKCFILYDAWETSSRQESIVINRAASWTTKITWTEQYPCPGAVLCSRYCTIGSFTCIENWQECSLSTAQMKLTEAPLPLRDRATRYVSWNLVN